MGGQEPGTVQKSEQISIQPAPVYEPNTDRGYSIISGAGPGENTLKAMERGCTNVPLNEIMNFGGAQFKGQSDIRDTKIIQKGRHTKQAS